MKILMLAWRDMKNPLKGGAEIVTDVYLKKLSEKGHEIVLFSGLFKNGLLEEEYNGYKIIRNGGKLSVYLHGLMYAKKSQDDFDLIIDQVNTIPFFTPIFIDKNKRIAYFNQLCLDVWFYEKKFPLSLIGYIAERVYLKLYSNTRCFTISESTANDLVRYAGVEKENILVSEMQVDFKPIARIKPKENSFVFCGRLKKSKRVEDCVKALSLVGNVKLYIIGEGDNSGNLYDLASKLNVSDRVIFTSSLDILERNKIMSKCIAILVTSVKEGWGLIVTEANANGTTAITYNVDGLRDANKAGFICEENKPECLAKYMNLLMNDKELLMNKSKAAVESAQTHSDWDGNVRRFEEWINL